MFGQEQPPLTWLDFCHREIRSSISGRLDRAVGRRTRLWSVDLGNEKAESDKSPARLLDSRECPEDDAAEGWIASDLALNCAKCVRTAAS